MKTSKVGKVGLPALFVYAEIKLKANYATVGSVHSSVEGFERRRLTCERRDLSSKVRFFALCGTRVGTRVGAR